MNSQDCDGRTALMQVVDNPVSLRCRYLIRDSEDCKGCTDNVEAVSCLIEAGADMNK